MRRTALATAMTAMLLAGVTAGFVLWGWRPSRAAGDRGARADETRADETGASTDETRAPAGERGGRAASPSTTAAEDNLAPPPRPRSFAADTGASPLRPFGGARAARERMSANGGLAARPALLQANGAGDPRAALAAFERILAAEPSGAAREQAMVGRARTLELLGERAQAAVAWRAFVEAYPQSMNAPLARRRIIALAAFPQAQP